MLNVEFTRLTPEATPPERMTVGAAGYDLRACLTDPLELPPGGRALVPTGLAIALPPGFEGQVRPRSGLAFKEGVTILNAPGTIDADYRGPLGVLLVNLSDRPFTVRHGERIAQLVVAPVVDARFVEVARLSDTARGEGGFGHTGR